MKLKKSSSFKRFAVCWESVISIMGMIMMQSGLGDHPAVKEQLICSCTGCVLLLFFHICSDDKDANGFIITLRLPDLSAGCDISMIHIKMACKCVSVCVEEGGGWRRQAVSVLTCLNTLLFDF